MVETTIWEEYQKGMDYLYANGIFDRVDRCYEFTLGDQWKGLKCGDDKPPQLNILYPIMKQATALLGQNDLSITYTSQKYNDPLLIEACNLLNSYASENWESLKFDNILWEVLSEAFISGDSILYFYEDDGMQIEKIDATEVIFADEQNPDIQTQPYILFVQRRYVEDVQRETKETILADEDDETKVTCITKFYKKDGKVYISRATKSVIYMDETEIKGMKNYPICKFSWKLGRKKARGQGDIWDKIPNQISINKNLYRFESAIKASAFPHKIYKQGSLTPQDVQKLSYPDSNIEVSDVLGQGIFDIIGYMQPGTISPYAKDVWVDLITLTRDMAGVADNLENVDPEAASGAAIYAAIEAQQLSVNMQMAAYKQFIEEIALVWFDFWCTYSGEGIRVRENNSEVLLSKNILKQMKVKVKVDISPQNPFSKMAQEAAIKELFTTGAITFEEYLELLPTDSLVPKARLEDILSRRDTDVLQQTQDGTA